MIKFINRQSPRFDRPIFQEKIYDAEFPRFLSRPSDPKFKDFRASSLSDVP